jgi:hypothetical protein
MIQNDPETSPSQVGRPTCGHRPKSEWHLAAEESDLFGFAQAFGPFLGTL